MDLIEFAKKLFSEWPTVVAAPRIFVITLLFGLGAGWFVAWLVLQQRLTHYRERIEHLQEIVSEKISGKTYRPIRFRRARSMTFGLSLIIIGLLSTFAGLVITIASLEPTTTKSDNSVRTTQPETPRAATGKGITMEPAGPIEWQPGYVLAARSIADGIEIFGFQATGTNTSDEFIERLGGFVRSEITGHQFPILVSDGGNLVDAKGFGIPAKHQFNIGARFVESGGMSATRFLRDFGRLTFQFEYGGKVYRRHFLPEELEAEVRRTENDLRPRSTPSAAGVRRSPTE